MNISKKGISLIKEFEGFSPVPYICPAGKTTIGYGHVINSSSPILKITEEAASVLLQNDLVKFECYLKSFVKVYLSQGEFDALCSLIYNWGTGNFGNSQGLKYLNEGNYDEAAIEFFSKEKGVVNINGKFSEGLYKRRQAELELWNEE